MINFNNANIFDARAGSSPVSKICLGNTCIYAPDEYYRSIPFAEYLTAIYDVKHVVFSNTSASNITNIKSTYLNYITQKTVSLDFGNLTNVDSIEPAGVHHFVAKGGFTISTKKPPATLSIKIRIGSTGQYSGIAMDYTTDGEQGIKFYYSDGVLTARCGCDSSTNYHDIPLVINPHEYHIFTFTTDGDILDFYIDGKFFNTQRIKNFPSSIYIYSYYSNGFRPCFELFTSHKKYFSQNDVKNLVYWFKKQHPREKIVPIEKGLALYELGNCHEENTNGWEFYNGNDFDDTIAQLGGNCIMLNGHNASDGSAVVSASVSKLIDFTPYNKLYFLVSSSFFPNQIRYSTSTRGTVCGYSTSTNPNDEDAVNVFSQSTVAGIGGKVGQTLDDAVLICMDISQVTGEFSPFIMDGCGAVRGDCSKVYKVWLG